MSTKWAFALALLLLMTLLVAYFAAFALHTPQEVQTVLLAALGGLLPPFGVAVLRVLQNSPAGGVPIRKALNGGVTEHLTKNPQYIPPSIKHAVIVAEERRLDAAIGRKLTEEPINADDTRPGGSDPPTAPGGQ